jgi:hypothetical protein
MTTSRDLRETAVQGLLVPDATLAGANVFSPRTWATWNGSYPMLLVQTPDEDGQSWGPHGPPAFTVTTTLRVTARAQTSAQTNDRAAMLVEELLEQLREQAKAALVNYPPLMSLLQQYPFFRTKLDVPGEGVSPIGTMVLDLGLEFVQGPRDFYQPATVPFTGVDLQVKEPDGTTVPGLTINLPQ